MSVAKVTLNGSVIVDMTDATAGASNIEAPYTAYGSTGAKLTGTGSGGGSGITPTGNINITQAGTIDVTNYATATVASGTATAPSTISGSSATVSIGTNTLTLTKTVSVTPSITTAGYIASGTAGNSSVSLTASVNTRSSSDLTASGATVTAPAGYYASNATKTIANGAVTAPATITGVGASFQLDTDSIILTKTVSVTPNVTTAGYISSGTARNVSVSLAAGVNTQAAQTIHPSTSDQTISSGRYLTGNQTFKAVTMTNLSAGNIKSGVVVKIGDSTDDDCVTSITGSYSGGGGITPTGNINITHSGETDVTDYATATVPEASFDISAYNSFITESNVRKWQLTPTTVMIDDGAVVGTPGWIDENIEGTPLKFNAVAANTTITPSTAPQTIGGVRYMMEGAVTVSAMPSGSATAPASISGTAATVSTGTNTLTLTKTVSVTPSVSAGYVSSGTAGNSSVSLTANVTTQAAQTIHPSTSDQTIAASRYLTGAQTIKAVTLTNLTASNIKKDVVVKIGDSTDDDCVTSITGTYEGGGGGGGASLSIATANVTPSSASSSISFTSLSGEPTSFIVMAQADLATGASPYKVAAVVFDGTDLHGQTITNTSNAQVTYDGSSFSKSYSNGTLTITSTGAYFQNVQYQIAYSYGGGAIDTKDVQVGSGATSITFTGLEDEPAYWSCIFKSNFNTSNGYQRVIATKETDGVTGLEMDSGAHFSSVHWTSSYSNGSLTITSSGTNAGGYFHQPGYYQLTYAYDDGSGGGNYQTKNVTYTPSTSQQTDSVTADSGYDALKKVNITVNAVQYSTIYSGSTAPSSSQGVNGDIYIQT